MRQLAGTICVGFILAVALAAARPHAQEAEPLRWFKGNTHTHSLNSDGDSTPDDVVRWYREQRYHFLFLTDHNMVTPVEGLNAVFAMPDRFLVIRGEEVTDQAAGKPVHLNMLGGEGFVPPQGGDTVAEALRRNVAAITGARGVISINHPNFGWAMSAEDLAGGRGAHLLEIHNGHFMVNNAGGGGYPSVEALWDSMLSAGIRSFRRGERRYAPAEAAVVERLGETRAGVGRRAGRPPLGRVGPFGAGRRRLLRVDGRGAL